MKLNLGCGCSKIKGFINIDANPEFKPDLIGDILDIDFQPNSIDEIIAYHILEHIPKSKQEFLLSKIYKWMKPESKLYISVPDLIKLFKLYQLYEDELILNYIFGSGENNLFKHYWGFTETYLDILLKKVGFIYLEVNTNLVGFATEKYRGSNVSINKIYIKGKNG